MLNKRLIIAITAMGSFAIPAVSSIAPVAQAQEFVSTAADDASKQVIVDSPHVGDAKITGKVLVADGKNTQSVALLFRDRSHSEQITVTRENTLGSDLVAFEYTVPVSRPLERGETITVGIPGELQTFQTVTVQNRAITPETSPAPVPHPGNDQNPQVEQATPQPEDKSNPGNGQKPGAESDGAKPNDNEQQPEKGKKPEDADQKPGSQPESMNPAGESGPETAPKEPQTPGDKEQQKPESPEGPKAPENEGQKPGEEKKPEAPKTPEDKDKQPETPKNPGKEPKDPQVPGGEGKKPEVDKDALQGSSNIGDFFKTLAALGGVAGIVSGIVNLFSQGSSGANFLQPLRDFLAQFNSKF